MNREQLRQENQAIQRRYEVAYYPAVKKAVQIPVDRTIQIVKGQGIGGGLFYLHGKLENVALTDVIQGMALDVGGRFARRQWQQFQQQKRAATKGFGFNTQWVDWIKKFLFDFIYTKISFSVFETTKEALIKVLNQAITEGWGVDQTVKALEQMDIAATQAARIVRTEITRAANAGVQAASRTFPYEQSKEWLSAHDSRVRGINAKDHASHIALDGTIVNYESVFVDPVNGDQLRFPGDPRASAASTINCRCSMAVVAKIGENGRLIPKRNTIAV